MRGLLAFAFSWLLAVPGYGERWSGDSVSYDLLTLSDGLSDSTVFSLAEDRQGRLWFGTASGGVNKYDGYRITNYYRTNDPLSLSHSDAGEVFAHSEGLFVGTWGGGLNRLNAAGTGFERLNLEQPPARIQTLFEDRSGLLWVGSAGSGLYRFDLESGQFVSMRDQENKPLERVWSMAQRADGELWFAADDALFSIAGEAGPLQRRLQLDGDSPRALAASAQALWIGGNFGLYRLRGDRLDAFSPDSRFSSINTLRSVDGKILAGTLDGLWAFDPLRDQWVAPVDDGPQTLFAGRNIRAIHVDRTGAIWLATREAGLIQLHGLDQPFDGFATAPRIETVDAIAELTPNDVLLGSRQGLWRLTRDASGIGQLVRVSGTEDWSVNCLTRAGDQVLIGTRSGLFRFDVASGEVVADPAHDFLSSSSVTVVATSAEGHLWAGTWGEGLFQLDPGGDAPTRYWSGGDPALPDDFISVVVPDPSPSDGRGLWIGHWYEGVTRLEANGSMQHFRATLDDDNAFPGGHVHGILAINDQVWVGTSFGLASLRGSDVENVALVHGDRPLSVQQIASDRAGNLWLATTRGVFQRQQSGQLLRYGSGDGLLLTEFYARSGSVGRDGRLYFGGVGGFVTFEPGDISDSIPPPKVSITAASVDDQMQPFPNQTLIVPPGASETRLRFTLADFKDPAANVYRYLLEGSGRPWSNPSTRNEVSFAGLKPGDYRFRVTGANSNGVWSDHEAGLSVVVQPYWWQTAWGRVLIVAAALMLIYAWHWYRTMSIRRLNNKLEARVADQMEELRDANRKLATAAFTDYLTSLPNRRGFTHKVGRPGRGVRGSVALADIDDFKHFNDRFGHEIGDLVLAHVAECAQASLRPDDLVARWGGEEFVFFFADTGLSEATEIAERIRRAVAASSPVPEQDLPTITMTIGVAERQRDEDIVRCIDRADQCLYAGKRAGKDRVIASAA